MLFPALCTVVLSLAEPPTDSATTSLEPAPSAEATPETRPDTRWIDRFKPVRNMWELGVYGGAFILSEDHDLYDLDTGPQKEFAPAGPVAGFRAAYHPLSFLGLEGEFSGVWTHVPEGGEPAFVYGLRGSLMLALPLYRVVPFVLGGYGNLGVRSSVLAVGTDVDPAAHWGLGVKLYINRWVAVRIDGRHVMSAVAAERRELAHHGEVTFGVSLTLGRPKEPERSEVPRDRDTDGVPDTEDACPAVWGSAPDGCRPRDRDGDGFTDADDRCPETPGSMMDGCPPKDADDDGFLDERDRCPARPGIAPDGCPAVDSDGDGFVDDEDECPRSPGVAPDGCPPPPPPEPVAAEEEEAS